MTAERTPAPASPGASIDDGRAVLHVDIDAFFAAIEQQRDPRLQRQAGDRRRAA